MRLLVCGSRGWHNEAPVETVIRYYQEMARDFDENFVLIHGHCKKGADALADRVAQRLGLRVGEDLIRVPADWKRHRKGAGRIRNQQMLDEQHPDVVVAFRAAGESPGTDDMVSRARRADVTTRVIRVRRGSRGVTAPSSPFSGVTLERTNHSH